MSNLINKAKDALTGDKTAHHSNTTSTSLGTHGQGLHSTAAANTVDPRIDSNTGGVHAHHKTTTSSHGISNTTAGPHSSDMMNRVDPRVDSDRDHRNDPTSRVGGYGQTQDTYAGTGTAAVGGVPGSHHAGGYGQTQDTYAGTGSAAVGGVSGNHHAGGYGQTQDTYAGTGGTSTGIGHGTGPHNSGIANKLDPRVDSDRDHRNDPTSRIGGHGQTQDTYTGTGVTSTNVGHGTAAHAGGVAGTGAQDYGTTHVMESKRVHDSKLLNKLDPATKTDSAGRPI